jgi:hypothetical protein
LKLQKITTQNRNSCLPPFCCHTSGIIWGGGGGGGKNIFILIVTDRVTQERLRDHQKTIIFRSGDKTFTTSFYEYP